MENAPRDLTADDWRRILQDVYSTYQPDDNDHIRPDADDISLCSERGEALAPGGRAEYFGIEWIYRKEIRTVVFEEWDSKGTYRAEYPIPPDVEETKEGIMQYLREKLYINGTETDEFLQLRQRIHACG